MEETARRRAKQESWNTAHGITPTTIRKRVQDAMESIFERDYVTVEIPEAGDIEVELPANVDEVLAQLRGAMYEAAGSQRYEEAADLRDQVQALERRILGEGRALESASAVAEKGGRPRGGGRRRRSGRRG
jgi:excinuclease ABC subunit B